jgi:phosphoribosyl 1,2-cyclic phosphodiesterase
LKIIWGLIDLPFEVESNILRDLKTCLETAVKAMPDCLNIRFWGVRGSIACPGIHTVRYGGNTPCLEMQVGSQRLIFDGGTGLRGLGQELRTQQPISAHMFFTHTHWDHIQGFPFFEPAFMNGNSFHIYNASSPDSRSIQRRLNDQMLHPNFPVPLQIMRGDLNFHDLSFGETVTILDDGTGLGPITVENAPLNHPGGSTGYRVNWRGLSVAYITDTEHYPDRLDPNVLSLARQADVMIYDATYTDEEYHDPLCSKIGWGHSTWQEAVKVAHAAGVKQLVLFHHDPSHDDDYLDTIAGQLEAVFPNGILAREGLTLTVTPTTPSPDMTTAPTLKSASLA